MCQPEDLEQTLAEIQYLLERMLEMSERAAREDVDDAARARLQQGLALLRARVDWLADQYQ